MGSVMVDSPSARSYRATLNMPKDRVYPGRFLAGETSLTLAVAILWAFYAERIEGSASPEEVKWVDSLLRSGLSLIHNSHSHKLISSSPPLPFKVRFRPRTSKIHGLLETI